MTVALPMSEDVGELEVDSLAQAEAVLEAGVPGAISAAVELALLEVHAAEVVTVARSAEAEARAQLEAG